MRLSKVKTPSVIINRPGVAGAVLQTPSSFINSVSSSAFSSRYSTNLHSQAVRARELNFFDNVHLPPPGTCHMSHVTCHVSHVTFSYFFFYKVVKLVGGGSVINGAYPV